MNNQIRALAIVVAAGSVLFFNNTLVHGFFTKFSPPENPFHGALIGITTGLFIGQINLSSVWAAVSSGSLITRLPWSLLIAVLAWGTFTSGMEIRDDLSASTIGMMLAIGCLVTQIPLWIASRTLGWELIQNRPDTAATDKKKQFQIKQILIGTFALAIVLVVCRLALPKFEFNNDLPSETLTFFGAIAICNLLLVMPCVWIAMLTRLTWLTAVVGVVATIVVALLQFGGICLVIGGPGRNEIEWALVFIFGNLGQMVAVYVPLYLLKTFAGFELVRRTHDAERMNYRRRHRAAEPDAPNEPIAANEEGEVDEVPDDFFG